MQNVCIFNKKIKTSKVTMFVKFFNIPIAINKMNEIPFKLVNKHT